MKTLSTALTKTVLNHTVKLRRVRRKYAWGVGEVLPGKRAGRVERELNPNLSCRMSFNNT